MYEKNNVVTIYLVCCSLYHAKSDYTRQLV